jgi:hypothetical protein
MFRTWDFSFLIDTNLVLGYTSVHRIHQPNRKHIMSTIAEQVNALLEQNKKQDITAARNIRFWFDFFNNMKTSIAEAANYGIAKKFFSSDDLWMDVLMFSTNPTHYVMAEEDGAKLMNAFAADIRMRDAYAEFVSWTKEQGLIFEVAFLRPYPEDMAKAVFEFSVAE